MTSTHHVGRSAAYKAYVFLHITARSSSCRLPAIVLVIDIEYIWHSIISSESLPPTIFGGTKSHRRAFRLQYTYAMHSFHTTVTYRIRLMLVTVVPIDHYNGWLSVPWRFLIVSVCIWHLFKGERGLYVYFSLLVVRDRSRGGVSVDGRLCLTPERAWSFLSASLWLAASSVQNG
jgi:hypothetical protein